ncbi:MAG: hypothetical protein ACRD5H_00730 [Nitrososphaerales archaeon]
MKYAKLAATLIISVLFAYSIAYGQGRNYKDIWNYPSKIAEVEIRYRPENRSTYLENARQFKKTVLFHIREAYKAGQIDLFFKQTGDITKYLKNVEQETKSIHAEFDDYDKLIPVIDQLYADEANAGIPIVEMWKLAIDKLYGEDIEQKIKNIRGFITRVEQDRKK